MIRTRLLTFSAATILALASASSPAHAAIVITEWMYNALGAGDIGEYVEFTNTGPAAIDFTGWSFDDSSRIANPDQQSLSAFGIVAVGESVIFTDNTEADFRTNWGLGPLVKIIGGNMNNLSRGDEINLYDAADNLVDRLTYNDQTQPGTPRTQFVSGNPEVYSALGANNAPLWQLAVDGDQYGSYFSSLDELGNPGVFTLVPEPSSLLLAGIAGLGTLIAVWRRRRTS
jgi:predicted extracellular nuclease